MKLYDYQEMGRDFLRNIPKAGLFLDMGLGKTAIVLSALEDRHLPALVVAPKRVAEHVWLPERDLWRPDLKIVLAAGDPKKRAAALATSADITVIGRDNLKDIQNRGYRTFVMDESSSFKDRSTTRWKLARKIADTVDHSWEMTGTPSPNGHMDLWAQLYLLDKGERLGKNITGFRSRYFYPGNQLPNGVITDWILRDGAADRIHQKIEDICLYMENPDKADITLNIVKVDLPPKVMGLYKEFKRELVINLDLIGGGIHSAGSAAILTNRLAQLAAGFLYSDDSDGKYDVVHTEKLSALREIVEGTGSPLLVFYQFLPELHAIRAAFPDAVYIDEPQAIARWNRGEVPMLLAHPASAGHGLNLQYGGRTIVWMSPTWALEEWLQGNARLARPGQKHPVVIHVIAAERTVDLLKIHRLEQKDFSQEALLHHLESPL